MLTPETERARMTHRPPAWNAEPAHAHPPGLANRRRRAVLCDVRPGPQVETRPEQGGHRAAAEEVPQRRTGHRGVLPARPGAEACQPGDDGGNGPHPQTE